MLDPPDNPPAGIKLARGRKAKSIFKSKIL
jgi:hypothetical protein